VVVAAAVEPGLADELAGVEVLAAADELALDELLLLLLQAVASSAPAAATASILDAIRPLIVQHSPLSGPVPRAALYARVRARHLIW